MDQSLDDIRPERNNRGRNDRRNGGGRPRRDGGRNNNGVGKSYRYERDANENWVHDKYEDSPAHGGRPQRNERRGGDRRQDKPEGSAELEVSNLHYDLNEDDLRNLFKQCGEVLSVRIRYDRAGRSEGTARVRYANIEDAQSAVDRFDGANAYGQPITLTLLTPSAPRSLFDRISGAPRQPSGKEPLPISEKKSRQIDRYVPGEDNDDEERRAPREPREPRDRRRRSPIRDRRGDDRRGGERRGGRGRGRGERRGAGGGGGSGPRPKKTVEELDQEMSDYWGSVGNTEDQAAPAEGGNGEATKQDGNPAPAEQHFDDGDAMMVE